MTDFISVKLAASGGEGTITILNTGFAICVAFSILFFIVSVVLFFVFDIKRIFDMKTGRAEKQKIREMEEENALTGRLINPNLKSDNGKNQKGRIKQHSGFSEKLNRIKNNTQAVPGRPNIPGLDSPQYQPQNYQQEAYAPKPLMPAPQPEAPQPQMYASYQHDTEVIPSQAPAGDAPQTTVLAGDASQTTLLTEQAVQPAEPVADNSQTTLLTPDNSQTTLLTPDNSQTTLLSKQQPAPAQQPAPVQQPEEEPAQTSLLSDMSTSISSAEKIYLQPVHNIAQRGELGQAAGSIDFMVGDGETSRLDDVSHNQFRPEDINFKIIKDIMLIHSAESIN